MIWRKEVEFELDVKEGEDFTVNNEKEEHGAHESSHNRKSMGHVRDTFTGT